MAEIGFSSPCEYGPLPSPPVNLFALYHAYMGWNQYDPGSSEELPAISSDKTLPRLCRGWI